MADPDGDKHRHRVVYDEVEKSERLVYTLRPDDPDVDDRLEATVEFTVRDDTTTVTMEMRFESTEALEEAVEYGVAEGTAEILNCLAEYLANEQPK